VGDRASWKRLLAYSSNASLISAFLMLTIKRNLNTRGIGVFCGKVFQFIAGPAGFPYQINIDYGFG